MSLIYVEYISPKPGVPLADFQTIAGRQQAAWAAEFEHDELVLNLARTWRVGPLPSYMCIWHHRDRGLDQLDEWQRVFESGTVDDIEDPINLVIKIDMAGCYTPLLPPVPGRQGPYYAEFFEAGKGLGSVDAVTDYFTTRAERHAALTLHLVARRIGHLGPDPRFFAVWGGSSYAALSEISEELDGDDGPIRLTQAGLYTELGREII